MPKTRMPTQQELCRLWPLTAREAEVLQWVAHGKTDAEIGCIIGLSVRTVQKHMEHILDKLGVRTRTAAVMCVLVDGLGGSEDGVRGRG